MIDLRIYSRPFSELNELTRRLKEKAEVEGIELNISVIDNWDTILNDGIEKMPTIKVNGHINISRDTKENFNGFVERVAKTIFKEEQFGMLKRIYVPMDFSEVSVLAFDFAEKIAVRSNAKLTIVHVYRTRFAEVDGHAVADQKHRELIERKVFDFVESINQRRKVDFPNRVEVEAQIVEGMPDLILSDLGENEEGAMIVLGTTGEGNALKGILGSTSLKVAKNSVLPTILIPPNVSLDRISRLGIAHDPTNDKNINMDILNSIIQVLNSDIEIATILDKNDNEKRKIEELLKEDIFIKLQEQNPDKEVNFHLFSEKDVASTLLKFIAEEGISLLAMKRTNRSFFTSLFHRSVIRELCLNAPIPLIIF